MCFTVIYHINIMCMLQRQICYANHHPTWLVVSWSHPVSHMLRAQTCCALRLVHVTCANPALSQMCREAHLRCCRRCRISAGSCIGPWPPKYSESEVATFGQHGAFQRVGEDRREAEQGRESMSWWVAWPIEGDGAWIQPLRAVKVSYSIKLNQNNIKNI